MRKLYEKMNRKVKTNTEIKNSTISHIVVARERIETRSYGEKISHFFILGTYIEHVFAGTFPIEILYTPYWRFNTHTMHTYWWFFVCHTHIPHDYSDRLNAMLQKVICSNLYAANKYTVRVKAFCMWSDGCMYMLVHRTCSKYLEMYSIFDKIENGKALKHTTTQKDKLFTKWKKTVGFW